MPECEIIERAFQLAKSGSYASMDELEAALNAERYTDVFQHMSSPRLRGQLRAQMRESAFASRRSAAVS